MRIAHVLTVAVVVAAFSATAWAQTMPPPPPDPGVIHYPILNWDLYNPPLGANDLHIVVEEDNFVPDHTYNDPNIPGWQYDGANPNPGGGTVLSWSTTSPMPLPSTVHVGANLNGSGRVTDAYWTQNGIPIMVIPIVWELTWVDQWDPVFPNDPGAIWMRLQTTAEAASLGTVQLANIRTYADIPAGVLRLEDLNNNLDEQRLVEENSTVLVGTSLDGPVTLPNQSADFAVDSFFDVFVELSFNTNPDFQSLLVADVLVNNLPVGRFWNLNYQSPEPTSMVLLALGGLALIRRRRK